MSRPTREQVVRTLALVDSLVNPPMSGRYGRYADAVLALFPEPPTGDAETEPPYLTGVPSDRAYDGLNDDDLVALGFEAGVEWGRWAAQQPRETVTTAAELDALPVGSVVLDEDGAIFRKFNTGLWFAPQTIPGTTSVDLARNNALTVIHRPEETP